MPFFRIFTDRQYRCDGKCVLFAGNLVAFIFLISCPVPAIEDSIRLTPGKIDSIFALVEQENRYAEQIDTTLFFNLPAGVKAMGDDPANALIITGVTLEPGLARFDACLRITNPADGKQLYFAAYKVPFSLDEGLAGPFELMLVEEVTLDFLPASDVRILAGSYVSAGCAGFESLTILGRLSLQAGLFVPADEKGNPTEGSVQTEFRITTHSLNNLLADISLKPFQLRNLPDFTFVCHHLVFDMSDQANPAGLFLSPDRAEDFPGGNTVLWQGVYIGDAEIILGRKFRRRSDSLPVRFGVSGFIIDDRGFTGTIQAINLLPFSEGNMNGWNFSVDKLRLAFIENHISAGKLEGRIGIPSLNVPDGFIYSAIIDANGRYAFSISTMDSIPVSLWGQTRLVLDPGSRILVEDNNDTFLPSALLHGRMSLRVPLGEKGKQALQLADIRFQDMCISTKEPCFSIGYLSLDGSKQAQLAGFPVTIHHIGVKAVHPAYSLEIEASVNLLDQEKEGFAGQTNLLLVSRWKNQRFFYEKTEIGQLSVNISKPSAFDLQGTIRLFDEDPLYGNGFSGKVHLLIAEKFKVDGMAVFGNNGAYRYYCADVLFSSPVGIPAGPLNINQLGGGIYCRMKQNLPSPDLIPGISLPSELIYIPDKKTGLGLIMHAGFTVAGKNLLLADTRFEIAFNTHGGINRIGFDGAIECLTLPGQTTLTKLAEKIKTTAGGQIPSRNKASMVAGNLRMEMDFTEHAFHADGQIYINVAGTLKGDGPENLAGRITLHAGNDDWYLYIGTVQNPVGLNFANFGRAFGYIMAGKHLPDALPMNRRVAEILKLPLSEFQKNRNQAMLENATGVAFGSGFDFRAGGETRVVYGYFDIGAGFDLMLTNFGEKSHCAGHSGPPGINGWYAQGQVYAYLLGRLGVIVTVLKKPKKFDILNLAGAALLEAKGPNPMFLSGTVGGKYSILGGMIRGQCRFEITAGEKCEIVVPEASPANMELIGSITPGKETKDVDVCVTPRVIFNLPVGTEIRLSNEPGMYEKYRIKLEKCTLLNGSDAVEGQVEWNQARDVLVFKSSEILRPSSPYTFEVSVSFEEWKNGQWEAFTENGKIVTETQQVTFTTGPLPKEIPPSLISYSYPVSHMMNFYPDETDTGYIVFRQGLKAYFSPGEEWKQVIRFTPVAGDEAIEVTPIYQPSQNTLFFAIPGGLQRNTVYHLELVNIPRNISPDAGITEETRKTNYDNDSVTIEMRTRTATAVVTREEESVLMNLPFRTSKYRRLSEKINFSRLDVRFLQEFAPYIFLPGATFYRDELFDRYEIYGGDQFGPLLRLRAVPEETSWYQLNMKTTIYENYPVAGIGRVSWRSEQPVGIPPTGEIQIWQENYNRVLTGDEELSGQVQQWAQFAHFMYLLPYYWSRDYSDIRNQLANACLSGCLRDEKVEKILSHFCWPVISAGDYPVRIDYFLPGKTRPTHSISLILHNPFELPQPQF